MRWMGAFADADWRGRLVCLVKGCCGEWNGPKAPSSSCGERSQFWRGSNWECKVFFSRGNTDFIVGQQLEQ